MAIQLYSPFKNLEFEDDICFLSGDKTTENITVFPEWLMQRFNFGKDAFEMMDKVNSLSYADLKMPCARHVKTAIDEMEAKVKEAFEKGYEAVAALDQTILFQWIGRIVYGILYHELSLERKRLVKYEKEFDLSPYLRQRYGYFHLMLQSLIAPIKFVGKKPWSITVFQLKYSADLFSYRDDAVNLMFQLGVNGFGFVAALQDSGVIGDKEQELLDKIKGHVLHPAQFEELYARFHYSDYILQYQPKFKFQENGDELLVEALPMVADEGRPLFGFWDPDMFAQVMANYLAVYGFEKMDFLPFQKPPVSYLENGYTKDFIKPESIDLPF